MLTATAVLRYASMSHPPFLDYRRLLRQSARRLRHDPTPAERKLWFAFLCDLPLRFSRQKPLGNYIADFYCASRLLVIEIDGDSHFTSVGESYDARRTAALGARGIQVLRFTNLEVTQQFEAVCQRIREALKI